MRLYNTLTRRIEELSPREPGRLGVYVCGPTVQEVPHFGHARAALVPEVLRRYAQWTGVEVLFVRNVTDVDDKIIKRARELGRDPAAVAEANTRAYEEQMARLGVLPPDIAPRATGHIIEMIDLIERLIARGHAYELDGDVYFAVRSFPGYGKLSGRRVDDLRAGARVEADERKRDPLDFALWKAAKPGEPSWRSPWGPGRPGWHIECSAMAGRYLGSGFDVHAGGTDLIFPHHENEIAQFEAATGQPFARHWMHNELLSVGGEKMSKSLGNFITLDEAITRHGANVVRFFFLAVHYRSPMAVDAERLAEAASAVERWEAFLRTTAGITEPPVDDGEAKQAREAFTAAMEDDLNTAKAQAALFDLVSAGHAHVRRGRYAAAAAARGTFLELAGVLGYRFEEAGEAARVVGPLVEELLALRQQARERKDFATADAIRARLGELGVAVEDTPEGSRWHVARG
jgi:cysteinyl-tRNA synthetase